MFRRIIVEEWQRTLSIVSITLFLAVFILHFFRIRRIPRETISHMENLPLEKDDHD
ncbi:MAG: hypothetical protein NTV08_01500 [Verrucomicrobia bacterium]|nr:hypothetical protein [Verrucomicrobiota bacterium]